MTRTRINWFCVIFDLKRVGVSSYDIAILLDLSHTTVLRWGDGAEPRHDDGERLLSLWSSRTGKDRSEVQRIREFASI